MRKLKHIRQQRVTDCGVACICSIAGVSRTSALEALEVKKSARSYRTSAEEMRAALKKFRFQMLREVYCSDWAKFSNRVELALLAVNYDNKKNNWHWVVFDRSTPDKPILDPQSKDRRAIHSRTRLYSYYRIKRL